MTEVLATLRGQALRDQLVRSRLAVRDTLADHPSIALRDAIAAADRDVTAAMLTAIAIYESLVAAASAPEPAPHDEGTARSKPRPGLPPPRRIPSARPVTPT
ncbi:hypothetical protein FV226_05600 [Methylobacterium sp. WL12]|uniref:hypothetical protein n=1 Tax=Methylobacterium sp. WL12 TaxID=2603890 RepID=UPI0011C957F6|nr:hypothetical protein [Methylobacterium sp. WL12]TXM74846.1 hypothetical protein FV226_05600 [Methylobacterium sp. WL12]